MNQEGYVKLDERLRISVGRYTELDPGAYYRIERSEAGVLTLTPAVQERGE